MTAHRSFNAVTTLRRPNNINWSEGRAGGQAEDARDVKIPLRADALRARAAASRPPALEGALADEVVQQFTLR